MYENFLFLLSQFGFDERFVGFLRDMEILDLKPWEEEEHEISSQEMEWLLKVKDYLVRETKLPEMDAIGFMVYMFFPRKLKNNPGYRFMEPEQILDLVFHEAKPKLKVVDSE